MEGLLFADELCETRFLSCVQEWVAGTDMDTLFDSSIAPFGTSAIQFISVLGLEGGDGKTLIRRRARRD